MKAVLLTDFGDVDKLELADVPEPKPGAGEVKVKVQATSVNPIDWKVMHGAYKPPLPFPLGRDTAGEVVELGSGVTSLKVGDRVLGFVPGSFAEYVVAKAEDFARVPASLPIDEAAALPLVTTTGAQLIEENTKPKKGDTVLVTGAVGGVGRTAVYAAKKLGARVLAGVHAAQKDEAKELGADGIFAIDDDADIARLPELDEIADTVDGETIAKLIPHLKAGGRIGSVLGEPPEAKKRGIEVHAFKAHPDGRRLGLLAEAVARGELRIPIAERRPLADIREATRDAELGTNGKVILTT
jgi:NADPH:quinone reductase-like Zn-dependent oxidoreductase